MIVRLDLNDLNYLNICFNFVMMGYWLICEPSGMKIDIIRTSLEKIPEKYISFQMALNLVSPSCSYRFLLFASFVLIA